MSEALDQPTPAGTPDKKGVPFDPEKHAKYRSGRAMKRADGTWFENRGRAGIKTPVNPVKNGVEEGVNGVVQPPVASSSKTPVPSPFNGWEKAPATPVAEASAETPKAAEPVQPATPPKSTLGEVAGDPVDKDGFPIGSGEETAAASPPGELHARAKGTMETIEQMTRPIFGPDINHDPEEKVRITAAWERHYANGGKGIELSPGMALAMEYGTLLMKRWERPTFRQRCGMIWAKLSGKK